MFTGFWRTSLQEQREGASAKETTFDHGVPKMRLGSKRGKGWFRLFNF
jgi:hypothetical protein